MIGSCRIHQWAHGFGPVSDKEVAEAMRLARRAIEVGKEDPDALWMAAWTLAAFTGEHDTAASVIDRALTLNPSSAHAWMASGMISNFQNQPDRAIEALERAMRLSPLDPWGGRAFASVMSLAHLTAGRYEEAIRWADRALAAQPDYRPALRVKTICYAYLGHIDEARECLSRVLELEPGLTVARIKASAPRFIARHLEALRAAGLPEE
jgi:tetratricopeptide (TPR) repeat protein